MWDVKPRPCLLHRLDIKKSDKLFQRRAGDLCVGFWPMFIPESTWLFFLHVSVWRSLLCHVPSLKKGECTVFFHFFICSFLGSRSAILTVLVTIVKVTSSYATAGFLVSVLPCRGSSGILNQGWWMTSDVQVRLTCDVERTFPRVEEGMFMGCRMAFPSSRLLCPGWCWASRAEHIPVHG